MQGVTIVNFEQYYQPHIADLSKHVRISQEIRTYFTPSTYVFCLKYVRIWRVTNRRHEKT